MRLEKDVQNLIKRLQIRPPVDIVGIAKVLGLSVWESAALPNGVAGKIFIDTENGGSASYSIMIRSQDPTTRKRFTVAHELAHYLLHRNLFRTELVDDVLYRSSLSSPIEAQANYLAADLLMPAHLLVPLAERLDVPALASSFEVSEQAITIRLASLPQRIFGVLRPSGMIEKVLCQPDMLERAIETGGGGSMIFSAADTDDFQRKKVSEEKRAKPHWV